MSTSRQYVLDSNALLAFFYMEEGHERVRELLEEAQAGTCQLFMSTVNLGEVLYAEERRHGAARAAQALARIIELPITIIDTGLELTLIAAHFKAMLPIAYADCFALALAQEHDAPVLTGDPELRRAEHLVKVEWFNSPTAPPLP